jgi:hypothetical protein
VGGESVVVPDKTKATTLWTDVQKDKMTDWTASNTASPQPTTTKKR